MIFNPHYRVFPEVAGSLGPNTVTDYDVNPPKMRRLHHIFHGWLGGEIVEAYQAYLVTQRVAGVVGSSTLTGASFADVEISVDRQLRMFEPGTVASLPSWAWMRVEGSSDADDFWLHEGRLVVSTEAFETLSSFDVSSTEFRLF